MIAGYAALLSKASGLDPKISQVLERLLQKSAASSGRG